MPLRVNENLTQITSTCTQMNLVNLEESWKKKVQLLEDRNIELKEEFDIKHNECL